MNSGLVVVLTTAPDEDVAATIARTLVTEQRAACINVLPGVRSFYRWEGKLQDDREVLLVAKVAVERFEEYRKRMKELHPYQVPEIVALDAAAVDDAYLRWCLT